MTYGDKYNELVKAIALKLKTPYDFIQDEVGQWAEPECTCQEDSKQRELCPVCDKEKYAEAVKSMIEAKKKTIKKNGN